MVPGDTHMEDWFLQRPREQGPDRPRELFSLGGRIKHFPAKVWVALATKPRCQEGQRARLRGGH